MRTELLFSKYLKDAPKQRDQAYKVLSNLDIPSQIDAGILFSDYGKVTRTVVREMALGAKCIDLMFKDNKVGRLKFDASENLEEISACRIEHTESEPLIDSLRRRGPYRTTYYPSGNVKSIRFAEKDFYGFDIVRHQSYYDETESIKADIHYKWSHGVDGTRNNTFNLEGPSAVFYNEFGRIEREECMDQDVREFAKHLLGEKDGVKLFQVITSILFGVIEEDFARMSATVEEYVSTERFSGGGDAIRIASAIHEAYGDNKILGTTFIKEMFNNDSLILKAYLGMIMDASSGVKRSSCLEIGSLV